MEELLGERPVLGLIFAVALIGVSACQTSTTPAGLNAAAPVTTPTREESRIYRGPSRDLSQDERAGGHILRKHVGLTEEDLRQRLAREPEITGASTYTDRRTAEHVVGAAIAQSQDRIEDWLHRRGGHRNLVLDYEADEPIGRTMNRGEIHSQPCAHALVVLRYAGPNDYYVLTSYPECRS
ncbi:MAG TPA: RNase A-like domain-containing protein [Terriglobales bacterium]|nr:RNase A-like domain-containing protein [Terriglobales bacterium]